MTGSEMIRPETMQAFFASLFRRRASLLTKLCPVMEWRRRLAVTFDQKGEGVRTRPVPGTSESMLESQEVVCVGSPVPDMEVVIADSSGRTLEEDQIGEIQVRGPSVFSGYYKNDEASKESLREDWLKTGDLGFVYDGELYIAGRSKEILVIRGDNVMPHEIEWLAEEARARVEAPIGLPPFQ